MGGCFAKQPKINSIMPWPSQNTLSEQYIQSANLTKRRLRRSRSKIIQDAITPKKYLQVASKLFIP